MKLTKIAILFQFVLMCRAAFAYSACPEEEYDNTMANLLTTGQHIQSLDRTLNALGRLEVDQELAGLRKSLSDQNQALSRTAAELLKQCVAANPVAPESPQHLVRSVELGRLYADAGDCASALVYFDIAKSHALYPTYRIRDIALAQTIPGYIVRCSDANIGREDQLSARYSGKSSYFLEHITPLLEDKRPYNSNDVERLAARRYSIDDTNAAKKLATSFKSARMFRSSFFNHEKEIIIHNAFLLVGLGDAASQQYLNELYDNTIEPTYLRLRREYFDEMRHESYLTIYIYKLHVDEWGLAGFNRACREVHSRSCGFRIGYYLAYDNSVMVWISTGRGTLKHELVHALMASDFPDAPIWLSEGISSLNESSDDHERHSVNYRLIHLHGAFAKFGRLIPLRELLAMKPAQFNSSELVALNTAISRYFAMYLYERRKLADVYKAFREAGPSAVSIALIEKILGMPEEEIQVAWETWVQKKPLPSASESGLDPQVWAALEEAIRLQLDSLETDPWSH